MIIFWMFIACAILSLIVSGIQYESDQNTKSTIYFLLCLMFLIIAGLVYPYN